MKLSKYAALAKREAYCTVFRVENDGVWLGVRGAIYRAPGLPDFYGEEQAGAILSLDEKQMGKVYLQEYDCESTADIIGYDLRDWAPGEQTTSPVSVSALVNKKIAAALRTNDGELLFYDENYLQPLADVLKDSDYLEMTVRRHPNGQRYIAVKDGFTLLAAFMPVRLVTTKYIGELQEFEALCMEQLLREQNRAEQPAPEEEPAEEQTSMEESENEH
jgi:hypothetical protein